MAPEKERLKALNALVQQYSPALIEFIVRSYRIPDVEAEEWVQGFIVNRVLARKLLANADQSRGKFRTFLLQAIQSYIADERRAATAKKRYPSNGFLSIEELSESTQSTSDPAADAGVFDEVFARQLVLDAIRQTHEYCLTHSLADGWRIFSGRIIGPLFEDLAPIPYEQLMSESSIPTQAVAYSKLSTIKDVFRRQFRALVEDYAADRGESEEEIRFLKQFLKNKA